MNLLGTKFAWSMFLRAFFSRFLVKKENLEWLQGYASLCLVLPLIRDIKQWQMKDQPWFMAPRQTVLPVGPPRFISGCWKNPNGP